MEAARLLASMGYETAGYSPSAGEPFTNIDLTHNDFAPPTVTQAPLVPLGRVTEAPQAAPDGTPVGLWDDLKNLWEGITDSWGESLQDPFGPVDDILKFPWDVWKGGTGAVGNIMSMLPMLLLMGGKIDIKKILMIVMLGGLGGGLGGLFGGGSNQTFGGGSTQLMSSHSAGGMDPMMMMLLMGNGGGSSNKLLTTMMMAPMLGIDPMSAMMLGTLTSSTGGGRRSYRRRGYSSASKRSYSAGVQAGQSRALMARS